MHKSVTVQSDTGCFFRNRISCGNRDKTDRKEALLSGQGFFYLRNRWAVTIPEARIAGSL